MTCHKHNCDFGNVFHDGISTNFSFFYCRYENDQLRSQGLDFTNIVTQVQNLAYSQSHSHIHVIFRAWLNSYTVPYIFFCVICSSFFLPHPPACVMVARVAPPKAQVWHSHKYCGQAPAYLDLQLICRPFLPCPTGFQFPGCDSVFIVHSTMRVLCPHLTCRRRLRR